MATERDQLIEKIFEDFGTFRRVMLTRPEHQSKVDLPRAQMEVLFKVWHDKDLSIKQLAESMKVTGSAVTQIVEALVQSGALTRSTDPSDRRIVRLSLTPDGRNQIMATKKLMLAHVKTIMASLDETDLSQLHVILQKIIASANEK